MTIQGWVAFTLLSILVLLIAIVIAFYFENTSATILIIVGALVVIGGMFAAFRWYYSSTASGKRAVVDQNINLNDGIERHITVYTANGDVIAEYQGKIDIEANDGGYIKFDYNGKRYIYYNCFVESIADLNNTN